MFALLPYGEKTTIDNLRNHLRQFEMRILEYHRASYLSKNVNTLNVVRKKMECNLFNRENGIPIELTLCLHFIDVLNGKEFHLRS